MKLNIKNLVVSISALIMLFMITIPAANAVSRTTVCVFCTEWNAKCREAVPAIESVVRSYQGKIDIQELNLDLNTTPSRARELGINLPSTIPYVVVIDKNGNTIFQQTYTKQTPQQLRSVLDSLSR